MICWSPQVYHENRDHEIEEENNPDYGTPFPAFRGHVLFRACHCPGKATVFGIEKQNQDVYNKDELSELIGKTVITRRNSAASVSCTTTARETRKRMQD